MSHDRLSEALCITASQHAHVPIQDFTSAAGSICKSEQQDPAYAKSRSAWTCIYFMQIWMYGSWLTIVLLEGQLRSCGAVGHEQQFWGQERRCVSIPPSPGCQGLPAIKRAKPPLPPAPASGELLVSSISRLPPPPPPRTQEALTPPFSCLNGRSVEDPLLHPLRPITMLAARIDLIFNPFIYRHGKG